MFAKVMKQDFRDTWKVVAIAILVAVAVSLSSFLLVLSDFTLLNILGSISGLIVPIVLIFGIFVYLARNYYQTMYGKRAYFTHSLPVKTGTILAVKTLWFYLVELLVVVVSIFALLLVNAAIEFPSSSLSGVEVTAEYGEKINAAFVAFGNYFAEMTLAQVLIYIAAMLAGVLTWVIWMIVCFAIASHRIFSNMSETAAVIISAIGTYLVYQLICLIVIFAVPVQMIMVVAGSGDISGVEIRTGQIFGIEQFITENSGIQMQIGMSYSIIPLGVFVAFIVIVVLGYWLAHRIITRHLNLR